MAGLITLGEYTVSDEFYTEFLPRLLSNKPIRTCAMPPVAPAKSSFARLPSFGVSFASDMVTISPVHSIVPVTSRSISSSLFERSRVSVRLKPVRKSVIAVLRRKRYRAALRR